MRVLIVTEGGKKIGLGHIARCMSLYQAFKKEGIRPSFVVNGDKTAGNVLAGHDYIVFNWLRDKRRLFNIAKDSDIAVIDSYLADAGIYKEVAGLAKTAVYLDDNMRIDYPRGIVVNGTVFAKLMRCPKSDGVEYLLGSRYIPLRKEFWDVPAKPIRADIKSIIVTFGGTDGKNMTPKILSFLNSRYPEIIKNVIVGAGFKNNKEIERLKDEKVNLIYRPDAKAMRATMLKSDIAVSAAGQTLYELARIGVPTIAVCVADNQERSLAAWRKTGFIEYAGWHNERTITSSILKNIVKLLPLKKRRKMNEVGRRLVDGKGAQRIVEKILWKA